MRLLLNPNTKHLKSIISMMNHGTDFDCMKPDCPVCTPYREKEKTQWDAMSEEERKQVHFGRIG